MKSSTTIVSILTTTVETRIAISTHVSSHRAVERMGKLGRFQIILHRPDGVYYPGEVVAGKVYIEVREEISFRGEKESFNFYSSQRSIHQSSFIDQTTFIKHYQVLSYHAIHVWGFYLSQFHII